MILIRIYATTFDVNPLVAFVTTDSSMVGCNGCFVEAKRTLYWFRAWIQITGLHE